jgi:hypothetical protein
MQLVIQASERVKVEEESVASEHIMYNMGCVASIMASGNETPPSGLVLPGVPAIKAAR